MYVSRLEPTGGPGLSGEHILVRRLFLEAENSLSVSHAHHALSAAAYTCRRRMMWFQREEPGVTVGGPVGGFRNAGEGGTGEGGGAERDKESSANQAFRRSGRVRMTRRAAAVLPCIYLLWTVSLCER